MKVMVTGATGFVGQHVVTQLLKQGHAVVAIARNMEKARTMPWYDSVEFIACDLQKSFSHLFEVGRIPDAIVHLSWSGLPNYRDYFHISKNLPSDLAFLEAAVKSGVSHVVVAGTCLEYGMQYGPLTEDMQTCPTTPYGFAKDTLRKALQLLQVEMPFTLQWMRLFYMYGEGQNGNCLLSQFDQAIREDQPEFRMSMGDQLRDYSSISAVADSFVIAIENPQCQGVINCCSGNPISVYDLVQRQRLSKSSSIALNRGYYPYPNYEPLAFWGVPAKLAALKKSKNPTSIARPRMTKSLKRSVSSAVTC
jgi:dTDP-6-deoxy-L-talose 4-dehydrogenase (NAD+)